MFWGCFLWLCFGVTPTPSKKRASGVLVHITSLPSVYGIGDLGPQSYRFADLLASQHQRFWSILPFSPTRLQGGNSPYQTSSAFAGNPLLVSPELLIEDGLLTNSDVTGLADSGDKVHFEFVYPYKAAILSKAYANFRGTKLQAADFEAFCSHNQMWLDDYALYVVLRQKSGKPWHEWLPSLRNREPKALTQKQQLLSKEIALEKFAQYLFFSQWHRLKKYCRQKQISIVGDMPFYVAHDSSDVWVHPELFCLYDNGKARYVGGVPPDYFSATGQLWGNPIYNWQKHQETGFQWWIERISHNLTLCDLLRLDHFRGFVAYWQVSAAAKTAKNGRWVKTPSEAFFRALRTIFPHFPFIAEDLGYIDDPVEETIKQLGVPGMRVILFGFDGDKNNPHSPSNHTQNSVVYTGTHDTNTAKGWFTNEASAKEKQNLYKVIGRKVSQSEVSFEVVRLALSSVANLSIVPLQDILGLSAEARMNNPSRPMGNWQWRATNKQLQSQKIEAFGRLTVDCNRAA